MFKNYKIVVFVITIIMIFLFQDSTWGLSKEGFVKQQALKILSKTNSENPKKIADDISFFTARFPRKVLLIKPAIIINFANALKQDLNNEKCDYVLYKTINNIRTKYLTSSSADRSADSILFGNKDIRDIYSFVIEFYINIKSSSKTKQKVISFLKEDKRCFEATTTAIAKSLINTYPYDEREKISLRMRIIKLCNLCVEVSPKQFGSLVKNLEKKSQKLLRSLNNNW